MARKYEGSAEDEAEDARGAKATGMSRKAYEGSARDRREDRAGSKRHKKHQLPTRRPTPPMPGPNEFDASQEQSMRAGARQSRAPMPGIDEDVGEV